MKNSKENQQTWVIIPHLFSLFLWHSFSFSISSVVRHAHSLFHSLSIEWNVGGKLQNEIETSWESPKPSNQTPKEKRGTTKKYKIKKMSEKKMRTKESHRLLFIAFFWLLSSLLRFFYDDSDDMRMDFVCFMDSPEPIWNSALLTFWNKARHINMCCHLLNLKLLSRNFNTN